MSETPQKNPERPDETRANFTRKFLKSGNIDTSQILKMGNKLGINFEEKDYADDKKLVGFVKDIQTMLGFAEDDSAKGRDGMLGPNTLRALKEMAKEARKSTSKEARNELAKDIKTTPVKTAEVPTEHKGYDGQPETPLNKLQEVLAAYKGKEWIGRLEGNGGRPVVIYVPKGFDPSKPIEVAYHFHGTHSHLIDTPMPALKGASAHYNTHIGKPSIARNRIDQALSSFDREDSKEGRNAILIYPLSAGRRSTQVGGAAYTQGYDGEWMKKGNDTGDDMAKLHAETLAQLSQMGINTDKVSVTLSGHSAGGKALQNIITSGFMPDKVKYLDASYGSWATRAQEVAQRQGAKTEFEIYVHKGSTGERGTDRPATQNLEGKSNVAKYIRSPIIHDDFIENFI